MEAATKAAETEAATKAAEMEAATKAAEMDDAGRAGLPMVDLEHPRAFGLSKIPL